MASAAIRSGTGALAVALLVSLVATLEPRLGRAAPSGRSATVQRARQHFLAGKHAFENQSYARALREFQAGYALEPRPGFLLNMGHAARRMGQLRDARDYYQKFLASRPSPAPGEQRAATKLIAEIERELPPEPPARAPAALPPPAARVAAAPPPPAAPAGEAPAPVADLPAPAAKREPPPASAGRPSGPRPTIFPGALRAVPDEPAAWSGLDARPRSAVLVTTTSSPEDTTAPDAAPIYRRWWFWVGAGALAAGVVTAIVIGAQAGGSSARDNGSWGQLQL